MRLFESIWGEGPTSEQILDAMLYVDYTSRGKADTHRSDLEMCVNLLKDTLCEMRSGDSQTYLDVADLAEIKIVYGQDEHIKRECLAFVEHHHLNLCGVLEGIMCDHKEALRFLSRWCDVARYAEHRKYGPRCFAA